MKEEQERKQIPVENDKEYQEVAMPLNPTLLDFLAGHALTGALSNAKLAEDFQKKFMDGQIDPRGIRDAYAREAYSQALMMIMVRQTFVRMVDKDIPDVQEKPEYTQG